MPAASTTARTAPPAITPVPGDAGLSSTSEAENTPFTWNGIVVPTIATSMRCFLPSSTALRIASGTSVALPRPTPTCPARSPTTTSARKLNRRPPCTTFETRATLTTVSSILSRVASILGICFPYAFAFALVTIHRRPSLCVTIDRLKFQPAVPRALGNRRDSPVVDVATAIEDDLADSLGLGPLRDDLAHQPRLLHALVLRQPLERDR